MFPIPPEHHMIHDMNALSLQDESLIRIHASEGKNLLNYNKFTRNARNPEFVDPKVKTSGARLYYFEVR